MDYKNDMSFAIMEKETKYKYHKKREKVKKEAQGVVCKIECEECGKLFIGETRFNEATRMNQHKKDVEYQRTNNAIAKHVQETKHEINWTREKRTTLGRS